MEKRMAQKNKSFEEAFTRLEKIAEELEQGNTSLDEMLALFEEGMGLVRYCSEKLEKAELHLKKLVKEEEGYKLKDIDD